MKLSVVIALCVVGCIILNSVNAESEVDSDWNDKVEEAWGLYTSLCTDETKICNGWSNVYLEHPSLAQIPHNDWPSDIKEHVNW